MLVVAMYVYTVLLASHLVFPISVLAQTFSDAVTRNNDISHVSSLNKQTKSMYTLPPATTSATNNSVEEKPPKWLIYCSAVPTIFVFLVALIVIAIKNSYDR